VTVLAVGHSVQGDHQEACPFPCGEVDNACGPLPRAGSSRLRSSPHAEPPKYHHGSPPVHRFFAQGRVGARAIRRKNRRGSFTVEERYRRLRSRARHVSRSSLNCGLRWRHRAFTWAEGRRVQCTTTDSVMQPSSHCRAIADRVVVCQETRGFISCRTRKDCRCRPGANVSVVTVVGSFNNVLLSLQGTQR